MKWDSNIRGASLEKPGIAPSKHKKIGYLVPEFPGQTHLFLWREIQALEALGMEIDLYSTRPPAGTRLVHGWAQSAEQRTDYLVPFGMKDLACALLLIVFAGPVRFARCLMAAFTADDASWEQRLRIAMLILPAAKMASIVREKGDTHLHVASCADSANIALFASILTDLSYSLALLGPTLEGYGPNQKAKWKHASFVLVMSDLLYRVAVDRLRGHLPPIVEVVPVGVDLDAMRRLEPYRPWKPGQVCRIYSCGRLNPVKGHINLIEAVRSLRERTGILAELEIAGEDEQGGTGYRLEMEAHIARADAAGFVRLLGAVSEERHRDCLERAHVFALASLNEGISVALMEAMAMQTPTIATRVGGNGELIESGVNGILVTANDPAEFSRCLEQVIGDANLASALSNCSRQAIEKKFDSRQLAQAFLRCLRASERDNNAISPA